MGTLIKQECFKLFKRNQLYRTYCLYSTNGCSRLYRYKIQ